MSKSQENLFTDEEIVYLKSILTLNAMDIQRELIILNESEFIPRRYEKTLKHLEKQNNIIPINITTNFFININ